MSRYPFKAKDWATSENNKCHKCGGLLHDCADPDNQENQGGECCPKCRWWIDYRSATVADEESYRIGRY